MLTNKEQLKDRIEAAIKKMEYRLSELRADARTTAAEDRDRIQARLTQIKEYLKDGWDNMTETVSAKVNGWLDADRADVVEGGPRVEKRRRSEKKASGI